MRKSKTDQKGIISKVMLGMSMLALMTFSVLSYAKVKSENSFTRAVKLEGKKFSYPRELKETVSSGFADLAFMIDKNGRAFEPIITKSSNELIDLSVIKNIKKYRFSSAQYNGNSVDSMYTQKIIYSIEDAPDSVFKKFNRNYKSAMRLLGEEPVNKKLIMKMISIMEDSTNKTFYTQVFLYIAKLSFADKFGDNDSKIDAIESLLVFEGQVGEDSKILEKHVNISIRRRLINLYIKSYRYMDAKSEIKKLVKFDPGSKAGLDNLKNQISNIITNDQQVATAFQIHKRGYSSLDLYKDNFTFRDIEGQFETIKLRCDTKFIEMKFTPKTIYSVPKDSGYCLIQIIGEESSTAKLVQY